MLKNFDEIFSSIFGSRRASAPLERPIWKCNHEDNHTLSTCTEDFSFVAFIVFEETSGQRDLLKLRKIAISQNQKLHQNKKKCISNFYDYLPVLKISWKSTKPIWRNPLHKIGKKKYIRIEKKKQCLPLETEGLNNN